jgi:hypothetical protein
MTTLSATPLTSSPAMLRPLSPYERLFLAIDKINGFNFGIAVSFDSAIADARWRAAFEQVRKRHPLLHAGINEEDPHAPYFTSGADLPIPLAFRPRISSTDWQRVMESDIAGPFDLSTGPFVRAAVLQDERGCDLVITANHVVTDGMSVLTLVRDLIRVLAGEPLAELPVPLSADERAAEIRVTNPMLDALGDPADEPQPRNRTYASRNRKGNAVVSALRFSQEQTARLLRYARQEQTTIGAVLLAATASALRDLSPQLKEADLRLTTAVDARPYLGNQDDFVLSIIWPRAIVPYADRELGASARAIKTQIAPHQSFAAIDATFRRVDGVLAQELEASTLVNALAQGFAHDVGVSNLRTVEFPPVGDGLAVQSVWGPSVLAGYEGEHFIGSATFAGALHLTYSSFTPMPGLLEAVHETISNACGDA